MSNIHLHPNNEGLPPVSTPDPKNTASFFVLQSGSFDWSSGSARIVSVHYTLIAAELEARKLKLRDPQMYYGVAQLISEARAVKEPVETVRVFPTDDPS
jgi:hypothetical protein